MAIQNRRGDYKNYDPSKMVAGEFGFVLSSDPSSDDGKGVYATFTGGVTKRLATYQEVSGIVAEAKQSETNAKTSETNAKASETVATEYGTLAKSYAVGNTGKRADENTDNAKYYKEWMENSLAMSIPQFVLDPVTMKLKYKGGVFGFRLFDGHLKWSTS